MQAAAEDEVDSEQHGAAPRRGEQEQQRERPEQAARGLGGRDELVEYEGGGVSGEQGQGLAGQAAAVGAEGEAHGGDQRQRHQDDGDLDAAEAFAEDQAEQIPAYRLNPRTIFTRAARTSGF